MALRVAVLEQGAPLELEHLLSRECVRQRLEGESVRDPVDQVEGRRHHDRVPDRVVRETGRAQRLERTGVDGLRLERQPLQKAEGDAQTLVDRRRAPVGEDGLDEVGS